MNNYKRAELVIPKISKKKFLSLSAEQQIEYLRLFREQVPQKFEEWRKPHPVKIAFGGRNKTVDHKTPISKGGTNKIDNLCMCCASCNSKKGNKTEAEFKGVAI